MVAVRIGGEKDTIYYKHTHSHTFKHTNTHTLTHTHIHIVPTSGGQQYHGRGLNLTGGHRDIRRERGHGQILQHPGVSSALLDSTLPGVLYFALFCLCVSVSVSVCVFVSACVCVSGVRVSVFMYVRDCLCLCLCVCLCVSVCLSACVFVSVRVCLSVCLSATAINLFSLVTYCCH